MEYTNGNIVDFVMKKKVIPKKIENGKAGKARSVMARNISVKHMPYEQ